MEKRSMRADMGPVPVGLQAPCMFTGQNVKVTVDLKEMKAADKAEEDKTRVVTAHRKALLY